MAKNFNKDCVALFKLEGTSWQLKCWDLAKAKQPFAVEGFMERHRLFFSELCAAYRYDSKFNETKATFNPLDLN